MIKSKMDFKPRTQLTPTKFETAVFSFADRGEAEALGALLRLLNTRSRFFQSELARIRTMSGQNWPDGQPEYAINSARFGWIFESKCADLGGDEEGDGDGEKEAALPENIVNYGQSMPKTRPKDPQLWP